MKGGAQPEARTGDAGPRRHRPPPKPRAGRAAEAHRPEVVGRAPHGLRRTAHTNAETELISAASAIIIVRIKNKHHTRLRTRVHVPYLFPTRNRKIPTRSSFGGRSGGASRCRLPSPPLSAKARSVRRALKCSRKPAYLRARWVREHARTQTRLFSRAPRRISANGRRFGHGARAAVHLTRSACEGPPWWRPRGRPDLITKDYTPHGDHDISHPRRFRNDAQREPRRRERDFRRQGGEGHRHRDRERPGGDRRRA